MCKTTVDHPSWKYAPNEMPAPQVKVPRQANEPLLKSLGTPPLVAPMLGLCIWAGKPFNSHFSDGYRLSVSGVWAPSAFNVLAVHVLKVGESLMQDWNPWLLRENLWVLRSLPTVGICTRSGVSGEIVSQTLLSALMWAISLNGLPGIALAGGFLTTCTKWETWWPSG